MIQKKLHLSLIGILIFVSRCTLIPCTPESDLDYVKKTPSLEFLEGTYKLDNWTLQETQGYSNSSNARLNVSTDGYFELSDIPQGTIDFNTHYYSEGNNINVSGSWVTNYHSSDNTAKFKVDFNLDSISKNYNILRDEWDVYEKNESAVILIALGDPDDCATLRFIKSNE